MTLGRRQFLSLLGATALTPMIPPGAKIMYQGIELQFDPVFEGFSQTFMKGIFYGDHNTARSFSPLSEITE